MLDLTTKLFLAASFLIVGGVSAASAQLTNGTALNVNIPTPFVVKDKFFEAGKYTIERTPSTIDSPSLLILRSSTGDGIIFDTTPTRLDKASGATELVFDNAAGSSYLSRIVFKGDNMAIEVPKTNAHRNAATQGSKTVRVVLTQDTGF